MLTSHVESVVEFQSLSSVFAVCLSLFKKWFATTSQGPNAGVDTDAISRTVNN